MTGKTKVTPDSPDLELLPDAWDRFERAVDAVTKSGPQHRPPKPPDDKAPKPEKDKPAK